jgi:hypothetical protein
MRESARAPRRLSSEIETSAFELYLYTVANVVPIDAG